MTLFFHILTLLLNYEKLLFDLTTFLLFACSHVFTLLLNNITLSSFCLYRGNRAFILIWRGGWFWATAKCPSTVYPLCYQLFGAALSKTFYRSSWATTILLIVTQSSRKVDINLTVSTNRVSLSFGVVSM